MWVWEATPLSSQIQILDTVSRTVVGTLESSEVLGCNRVKNELVTFEQAYSYPPTKVWDVSVSPPQLLRSEHIFGGGCGSDRRGYQASFNPDGSQLYTMLDNCTTTEDGLLPGFYTETLTPAGSFLLEWQPTAGTLSPDGSRYFAAHGSLVINPTFSTIERHDRLAADIHVYDGRSYTELARFPLSGQPVPGGLQVSGDGHKLFALIDTDAGVTIESLSLEGAAFIVSGVVTDRDGTPVQAALVELIDESEVNTQSVATDSKGAFEFEDVADGRYTLAVNAEGFQTTERSEVVVSGGPLQVRPIRLVEEPVDPTISMLYRGSFLRQVLTDPVRTRAYVTDSWTNSLLVIDTESAALEAIIPVGSLPLSAPSHCRGVQVHLRSAVTTVCM